MIEKHHDAEYCAQNEKDVGPLFVFLPHKNKSDKVRQENKCHID